MRATCTQCGATGTIGHSIEHRVGCSMYLPPAPRTSAEPWLAAVEPQCPVACCFRLTCATATQRGIRSLWDEGRIMSPTDCVFYERRAQIHRTTTGCAPPESAEALLEQLKERSAIQAEGT